jgi:pyruvate formate-lyase/glycerol dehydratase family glycyl radical enzyme
MSRVQRLKAKLFESDDRAIFLQRMDVIKDCAERFRGLTAGTRFGWTLTTLLSSISIMIDEDDLIVGRIAEVVPTPEQECWFEQNREEYFRPAWYQSTGHLTISWERVLNEGMVGIRARASEHLGRLRGKDRISLSKSDFLQGAILCCDAIEAYADRYADEAEALARSEPSVLRHEELLRIAEVCKRVPAKPARTFHEAVQAVWLVDMVLHAVVGARDFALGRIDQYLYPYYARELAEGRITPGQAQELIECLYIKCNEIIGYGDQVNIETRRRTPCQDSVIYAVLGGQTSDGSDAANPLSTICLRAGYLKLKQPTLKIRYHDGIDKHFWREACKLAQLGGSMGFYNDHVEIPAFTSVGVDLEDARDYVHYGCCNANVPGKEGSLVQTFHNVPKYLELALNNGQDPLTGEQAGPRTGEVEQFESIDDVMEALRLQIRHVMEAERAAHPPFTDEDRVRCSFTAESVFLEDCIENGREWRLGGTRYYHKSHHASGIATVADSLAAIQQVVFDEEELALRELRDILNADFEGNEALRQRLRNRCPKYGNDDDGVDGFAVAVADAFCDEVVRCNDVPHNIVFWPEIYSYHHHSPRWFGSEVGATPDGRRRGETLSENQSPTYGMDRRSPTACLNSMAKLPVHRTPGGGTNLRLHPTSMAGEQGVDTLSAMLKAYFRQGGQHLQINIVDSAMLRDAQLHPDMYRTLSVRVVGYSAYFVALTRQVQDDIIRRTEYMI